MSLQDPISDMLTRVRNAIRSGKTRVDVKRTKACLGIAKVLQGEGYVEDVKEIEDNRQGILRIYLRYGPQGEKLIQRIERYSRPGRRSYHGVEDLPVVLDGLGVAVISTSQGILSDRQCREKRIGGEVLCTVS